MRHIYTPARGEHKIYDLAECEEVTDVNFTKAGRTRWIGDEHVEDFAAPGCGRIVYRFSRISDDGIFATYISGSCYEMDIEDCM